MAVIEFEGLAKDEQVIAKFAAMGVGRASWRARGC